MDELRQNVLESKSRPLWEDRDQCGATVTAQPMVAQQLQSGDFSTVFLINVNFTDKALSQHKRCFKNIPKNKVRYQKVIEYL